MKLGRNELCPCGSGKKFKHCCMSSVPMQHDGVFNDVNKIVAMNPNLTTDELNVVMQHKVNESNNRPNPDFCGLSSTQIANWMYAPLDDLNWVSISTPDDLSASPVMRYLELIIDIAMQNNGSFKSTSKGNLPTKLVRQASDLLPEFAVSQYRRHISINEFAGTNEDKFDALHYTRILAEMSGVIYRRGGQYHVKKTAQKQYQRHGIQAFFKPMLKAVVTKYNWGYFDGFEDDVDIRSFWLFMLWRVQSHASVDQLTDEVMTAFPPLLDQFSLNNYNSPAQKLSILIESRFIKRFLQFWGFVTIEPYQLYAGEEKPRSVQIQPLFTQTFQFDFQY